jgi:hypothetical protein
MTYGDMVWSHLSAFEKYIFVLTKCRVMFVKQAFRLTDLKICSTYFVCIFTFYERS